MVHCVYKHNGLSDLCEKHCYQNSGAF